MTTKTEPAPIVYRATPLLWVVMLSAAAMLYLIFAAPLEYLVEVWNSAEEYSYGYLIPVIVLFLLWQKNDRLQREEFRGSWTGVLVIVLGGLCYLLGALSTILVIELYGLIFIILGLAMAYVGPSGFRYIGVPLLMLCFMIPLPQFLLSQLSAQLQLISSEIGVMFIRAFDISVYLEGNVIDLGSYKLQVVEACSGLRYLFPLMVFGFILAYFFQSAHWKRMLIFLSTIPITILMNSIRIGIIGVTVEYWGEEMAEGFLHDFEGWVIFMACTLVLFGEMWLLSRLGRDRRPLKQIFGLDLPARLPPGTATSARAIPKPLILAILLIVTLSGIAAAIPHRTEVIPERESFASFPLQVDEWVGRNDRLEQIYIDTLKFSDYLLADFRSPEGEQVNLYIAYYGSQKSGESAHSPRSCLPGGGWSISNLTQVTLSGAAPDRQPLHVNRVVIKNGDRQQLVYYWFQQRGRAITSEYLVKWYLFWDSLTKNRTDGALIRLTIPMDKNRDIADADRAMQEFATSLAGTLGRYIPD